MRLTILTLAHHVHNSEPGGLLNISGIYSGLASNAFPFTTPRLLLVARFTGSPVEYGREFELMLNFLDEDGLPGPIPSEQRRLRMVTGQSGEDVHCNAIFEFFDVTFTKPGWYQFFIHIDNEIVDDLAISVAQAVRR
jgi:hypothetical protein